MSVETIAAGSCGDPARPGGAGQTGGGGDGTGGPVGRGRLGQPRELAIIDQPDPGARDHRLRARIRECLHLELALPAVDGIEAAFGGGRMTGELRESRAQLLEEVHERVDADQAEIRAAVGPLPVEVADVPDPGGAAKRDAVIAAHRQEEASGGRLAMHVVVGVQVGREGAGQIAEGIELARQLPLERAGVREIDRPALRREVDVEPDAQPGMPAGQPGCRARPGMSTIRLALVTMPRSCASMMPRLTCSSAPKSSALTIRYRVGRAGRREWFRASLLGSRSGVAAGG